MSKGRLEAFSDAVIAIAITIMVLDLRPPHGADWIALRPLGSVFLIYVLSYIYLGIYWNNHHHMFHATERINGRILWTNLHLLFWLSLTPFVTDWMGATHFARLPTAVYGVVMLMAALAYYALQTSIIVEEGPRSKLATAVGKDVKGKLSPVLYLLGILLTLVDSRISFGVYALVAVIWFVPDQRIEAKLTVRNEARAAKPRHSHRE